MIRHITTPRTEWQKTVESQGLLFHSADNQIYWDESAYYSFTSSQVEDLEKSSNELQKICLEAVQHVIDNKRYADLKIPALAIPLIETSWEEEHPAIYGRFDLSYDGKSAPKLLEYNADTPTSLIEAAVIQWYWLQDKYSNLDQFNSIHERLIAKWTELKDYLHYGPLTFASIDSVEDYMNLSYMRETAHQAGLETKDILIPNIGWDSVDNLFVDMQLDTITNIFKLYPWEWLLNEEYGKNIEKSFARTFWIEPPWKMILSNKGILPILWELNPGHRNLLPSYFKEDPDLIENGFVKKPLYSREGANITIHSSTINTATTGEYGEEGFIYQQFCPLPNMHGNYPVIGSWIIDGESAGIGIRESKNLITDNMSRFIPHIIG